MKWTFVLALLPFIGSFAFAVERQVPGQYATIQAAIDASVGGDSVLVAPGTYYENIDFLGKAITVRSSDGPEVTILEGVAMHLSVVTFRGPEGNDCILEGFTVQGGQGTCFSVPGAGNYSFGGGIFCDSGASPTIANNIIRNNTTLSVCANARRWGGGIGLRGSSNAIIVGNVITGNAAEGGPSSELSCRGGGIHIGAGSTAQILDNVITGNSAGSPNAPSYGGGLSCVASPAIIDGNTITANTAERGGGVHCFGDLPTLVAHNEISGNSAEFLGGGVYLQESTATVFGNRIAENVSQSGGGLAGSSAFAAVRSNRIQGNHAQNTGGGLYFFLGKGKVENNIVSDNECGSSGGGIYVNSALRELTNNTIVGNIAATSGGGLFDVPDASTLEITNSIFWNNLAPVGSSIEGVVEVAYCDIEGGYPGEGNIDADPRFRDPGGGDYRLRLGSPCADAGSVDVVPTLPFDYEGDPRPLDGDLDTIAAIDIGADELRADRAVLWGSVNAGAGGLADVLLANGATGGEERSVVVDAAGPILFEMLLPPAGGTGKYAVHIDNGEPAASSITPLPAQVGWTAFPFLLSEGASPMAVFNNLGKTIHLGESHYFDGTPLPPPPRAPGVFLELPNGDASNLPPGTVFTMQGVILDPGTEGSKPASATNGVVIHVQ